MQVVATKAAVPEPLCHFPPAKSDVALDFEVWNQIPFHVAVQRLRADGEERGEFPGGEQSFGLRQAIENVGVLRYAQRTVDR
jgi:hypothetical protein